MKQHKTFKLVRTCLASIVIASSLSACAKKMDCNIQKAHVHLYVSEEGLSRYIDSEREKKGSFQWTKEYAFKSEKIDTITENKLCAVEGNEEYLQEKIAEYPPKRQAYVYAYVYGFYLGWGYGLNPATDEYEHYYGSHTGYHWDYEWQDIRLDEYTTDTVRDVTYELKFYKIRQDGTIQSKCFDSLEEIEEGYHYFKASDLIQERIGENYHMTPDMVKANKM